MVFVVIKLVMIIDVIPCVMMLTLIVQIPIVEIQKFVNLLTDVPVLNVMEKVDLVGNLLNVVWRMECVVTG